MATTPWHSRIPPEADIQRVMAETGMDRMQAINHLRCRYILQQRARRTVPLAL